MSAVEDKMLIRDLKTTLKVVEEDRDMAVKVVHELKCLLDWMQDHTSKLEKAGDWFVLTTPRGRVFRAKNFRYLALQATSDQSTRRTVNGSIGA
jgi:hypothetical protein